MTDGIAGGQVVGIDLHLHRSAGAALHHQLHFTVELAQPLPEADPVRRRDPTPLGLTCVQVDPVEGVRHMSSIERSAA